MLKAGLLAPSPFEEAYGLHDPPGLPVGHAETRAGAVLAAEDNFEIVIRGKGGDAARPQWGREVLVPACALVMELQTIVSRRLSPADVAVVSVTELLTDGTRNALPGLARVLGDARSFRPEISTRIEEEMRRIAEGTAIQHAVETAADRPAIEQAGHHHAEEAAMEGHAAVPHLHDLERVGEVEQGLVEQDIAEPPAQHDAQHRPDEEIIDLGHRHGRLLAAPEPRGGDQPLHVPGGEDQPDDIGHRIPAHREGAELDDHRIDVRKGDDGKEARESHGGGHWALGPAPSSRPEGAATPHLELGGQTP